MASTSGSGQTRLRVGEDGVHPTFCRLCEAFCGLVATVENGRVTTLAPDRANPHSQGHVCVKGVAFHHVTHDPDRVLRPLKRTGGPGTFTPVSWEEALGDIAARLRAIIDRDGPDAVAFYIGNPSSYATDAVIGHVDFMRALGGWKGYSPGSQDTNSRSVANYALFGNAALNAFPDLPHCDFLLILGANPLVSNGSILWAPRIRHDLDVIAGRGRVVVVDPRRTETARRYEHVPVRPAGDVWVLLGMLRSLQDAGLIDWPAVAEVADGGDTLRAEIARVDVEAAAGRCGVPVTTIRQLAQDFAAAPRAAAYSRLGICRTPVATLTNALVTILNIVTGNFGGRRGGAIFGHHVLAGQDIGRPGGYDEHRSRAGNLPSVLKFLPSAAMPDDILQPGPGQVRALMVTAGNPLHSAPGAARLEAALAALELSVTFDFYRNETARYADYVLPTPTFLERADMPFVGYHILMRPFLQFTDAVIPIQGDARHEHRIYREIVERMGLTWPGRDSHEDAPGIARLDRLLRAGPAGDGRGEDGWSVDRLRGHPHGVMIELEDPTARWRDRLGHPDKRLQLVHPLIQAEFARLWREQKPAPRLALIGRRDIRSMNSWMHNVDGLIRSQKPRLIVHPTDAEHAGVSEGDEALLATAAGRVSVTITISDEMMPGTVCYPHGWGHGGGWERANAAPGHNVNALLGLDADWIEPVSGTTIMEGFAVTLQRIDRDQPA